MLTFSPVRQPHARAEENQARRREKAGLISAVGITLFTGALTVYLKPAGPPRLGASEDKPGLYLVITRSLFNETLDRWAAERRKNGFDVLIRPWKHAPSTRDIRDWIGQQVDKRGERCRYILIVGDCGADEEKWDEYERTIRDLESARPEETWSGPPDYPALIRIYLSWALHSLY